jgi:SAM-dependent methyltransferase
MSQPPDIARRYYQRAFDFFQQHEIDHPHAQNPYWHGIRAALQKWIADRRLERGRVLEVGCGVGLMQDVTPGYVGTDLAANVRRWLRKPFYVCSGDRLPFADNSFDGAFSIWVLEHLERPEAMLAEMRRVVRPGGSIFLAPAYAVDTWVAQGIHKRPYRDLTPRQRLTKLSIPLRRSAPYKIGVTLPRRVAELLGYLTRRRPTPLRYRRLQPNFEKFWDDDSDAAASLDAYSLALYFLSRGDRPHYPAGVVRSLLQRSQPQAYVVWKDGRQE